jgi:hypothetical protein
MFLRALRPPFTVLLGIISSLRALSTCAAGKEIDEKSWRSRGTHNSMHIPGHAVLDLEFARAGED